MKKSVLIVDDNIPNCQLFEVILEDAGYNSSTVNTCKEFFNIINTENFNLVLMDIHMNETLTGIDLIKYMRNNNINTPVIIQTAYYNYESEIECHDVIIKPIKISQFLKSINKILQ